MSLGTSDIAIIRMPRRMLEAVKRFRKNEPLIELDPAIDWKRVKSEQLIL